jgi:hypothetical protein
MNIYIVLEIVRYDYDCVDLICAFENKQDAEKYAENLLLEDPMRSYSVREVELVNELGQ